MHRVEVNERKYLVGKV